MYYFPSQLHHLIFRRIVTLTSVGGKEVLSGMRDLVQYVVVRGDLLKTLGWPVGAVIAQACHASTAAVHMFYTDPDTADYLSDLDNMHKVVLEIANEDALMKLSEDLKKNDIKHKLWVEQPENFPTCLVLKPYPKQTVQSYFKKLKLFKV